MQRALVPDTDFIINNTTPKKVIRAIASYRAQKNGELSFTSGEFFYVINDSHPRFLDVTNPQTKQRGIVPVDYFEILDRADHSDAYVEESHCFPRKDSGYGNSSVGETAVPFHSTPHQEAQYLNLVKGHSKLGFERKVDSQRGAAPATLGGRPPAPIVSVVVQAYERRQDGHYLFTLEVKREDQTRNVLFRVYDDIYILHISLLTHFPSESGRSDSVSEPRIIPLLQPPVPAASLDPNSLRQLASHVNVYFEELLHLPQHMFNSAPMKRFFVLRSAIAAINNGRADIETPLDEQMDVSATLIDMIHDYTDEGLIPIKVSFQNDNWVWKVFDSVGYGEFIEDIERRLGMRRNAVRRVQYRDETGVLVRLKGDKDLKILLRTSYSRLCIFVE
ncbi:hypothetical protein BJ742DRAFT_683557 [Cladochytrium replicatum]|nr:hypothetical protein BJ742DRAFT_683557 [Cladochytrium replicatum]